MHFLRHFLAFIQKLCFTINSFFQKFIRGGGVGIRAEGLENFSKINKRGGGNYSALKSIYKLQVTVQVQAPGSSTVLVLSNHFYLKSSWL